MLNLRHGFSQEKLRSIHSASNHANAASSTTGLVNTDLVRKGEPLLLVYFSLLQSRELFRLRLLSMAYQTIC